MFIPKDKQPVPYKQVKGVNLPDVSCGDWVYVYRTNSVLGVEVSNVDSYFGCGYLNCSRIIKFKIEADGKIVANCREEWSRRCCWIGVYDDVTVFPMSSDELLYHLMELDT